MCWAKGSLPSCSLSSEHIFPYGDFPGWFPLPVLIASCYYLVVDRSSFHPSSTRSSAPSSGLLLPPVPLLGPFSLVELPAHPPRSAPLEAWQRPLATPPNTFYNVGVFVKVARTFTLSIIWYVTSRETSGSCRNGTKCCYSKQ
eukprot:Gb_40493 [translate_table: standard]